MKFRRLKKEELEELEEDFIRFLAANSVTGPDWVKIKENDQEKANNLIDLYSEIVFDKTLKKVEYLEFKSPKDLKLFHCGAEKIKLLGLLIDGPSSLDFTQNTPPKEMLTQLKSSAAALKLYQAEKNYSKEREIELFEMMENGCLISKGELFNILQDLKKA